jgi:hypothetical protein
MRMSRPAWNAHHALGLGALAACLIKGSTAGDG